jgi:heavy metal efflux system protein
MSYRALVLGIASVAMVFMLFVGLFFLGGEFMPQLEEGNLWVRATLPHDASFEPQLEW